MNILTNAIDAIESDPKHQKVSTTPTTMIETETIENWVLITLTDNGIGIPKSVQSKLFEPFFTTKPVGKGTGLGMSISYQVVTRHQGKLYCDSVLGKGTAFIIELPIQQPRTVDNLAP